MAEYSGITSQPVSLEEAQQFMSQGQQSMEGARFDTSTRGITTDQPESRWPAGDERTPLAEQLYSGGDKNWQQLYGQEANEKGEWRRTAQEAMAELQRAKLELEALRSQSMQAPLPGQVNPYASYSNVQTQVLPSQAQVPQLPERFFPDRSEEDIVQVKDVEAMLRNMVGPEVLALRQQTMSLQQLQLEQTKQMAGLTPQIEMALMQRYPWLNAVADPHARITAMRELVRGLQQQPAQPPRQAGTSNTEIATRRVTFVEGSNPSTASADVTAQDIFNREMAEAMQKPFGAERTQAMRVVFAKHGMTSVNDFGPDVLTR